MEFRRVLFRSHRLEAVATANLGYTISKLRIIKLLGRLINLKDNRKGLLQYLKNKLRDVSSAHDKSVAATITDMINTEIMDARQRLYDIVQAIFDDISNTVSNYVVSEG